MYPRDK